MKTFGLFLFCAKGDALKVEFVVILLAIVGLFFVLGYVYRLYKTYSKYTLMLKLIKIYDENTNAEASIDRLFYGKSDERKAIPHEIYNHCMENSTSRLICEKHRATEKDFCDIFNTLEIYFPATIKQFFVPISVFFFYSSLDYVLTNKDNLESKEVHSDLLRFFEAQ